MYNFFNKNSVVKQLIYVDLTKRNAVLFKELKNQNHNRWIICLPTRVQNASRKLRGTHVIYACVQKAQEI